MKNLETNLIKRENKTEQRIRIKDLNNTIILYFNTKNEALEYVKNNLIRFYYLKHLYLFNDNYWTVEVINIKDIVCKEIEIIKKNEIMLNWNFKNTSI